MRSWTSVGAPPSPDDPAECVADKGYHSRAVLTDLDGGPWKTRICEPQRRGVSRWHGDTDARRAVYNNRTRLRSGVGQQAMRNRAELVERSFAHILDRGGMRRTWLRGRENVHKRYLIHVAGHNLGLLMRLLIGAGTPKEAVARGWCVLILLPISDGAADAAILIVLLAHSAIPALIVVNMRLDRSDRRHDVVHHPDVLIQEPEPTGRILAVGCASGFLIHAGRDDHDPGTGERVIIARPHSSCCAQQCAIAEIERNGFTDLCVPVDQDELIRGTALQGREGCGPAD